MTAFKSQNVEETFMKTFSALITATLLALAFLPVNADEQVFTGEEGNVAVEGYDVVAYFTQGEPMQGSPEHSMQWRGAEWRFASADHLARFRENPERFAPAYGGYCAYGAAQGKALASSPHFWKIEDGRLYLNLNEKVHGLWNEDREGHIQTADAHWPDLEWE